MTIAATGGWFESWTTTPATARDRAASTCVRGAVSMTVGFLVAFLAMDFALAQIPLPRIYTSRNIARWKWELYERAPVPPEVVFLGCSYEWYGISPMAMHEVSVGAGNAEVHGLNLASWAAGAFTQYLTARHVVESGRTPRLAYMGVNPASMDGSRREWLIQGIRALGDPRDLSLAWKASPEVFLEGLRTAMFRSYRKWDDVRILVNRLLLAAPLNQTPKLNDHDNGWAEWIGGDLYQKSVNEMKIDAQQRHALAEVAGDYRDDGVNALALRNAVVILRKHGVSVRFLEMPLAPGGSSMDDPRSNVAYRIMIDRLADELRVPIVRPPADLVTPADFFDPGHMNARGATRFSRWLANDVSAALTEMDSNRTAQTQP